MGQHSRSRLSIRQIASKLGIGIGTAARALQARAKPHGCRIETGDAQTSAPDAQCEISRRMVSALLVARWVVALNLCCRRFSAAVLFGVLMESAERTLFFSILTFKLLIDLQQSFLVVTF